MALWGQSHEMCTGILAFCVLTPVQMHLMLWWAMLHNSVLLLLPTK